MSVVWMPCAARQRHTLRMQNRVVDMLEDAITARELDPVRVASQKRWSSVPDNFEQEVDEWFDELEGQLAPAGRITPPGPNDERQTEPGRPVLSHPSTLAPRRPVPGLRRTLELESIPQPEADQGPVDLAGREMQLVHQKGELVRTEALVDVMKELASEIRSVRRDVDQIKAIIAKLRRLAEAKRRGMASPATR